MDGYLRFFIKFHGYCIAIVSIIGSIYLMIVGSLVPEEDKLTVTIVFGVLGTLWMASSVLLLVGIFKEKKKLIYPFYAIILTIIALNAMVIIGQLISSPWFWAYFYNPVFLCLVFMTVYVILSVKALIRLFDVEPISSNESSEPALV